MATPSSNMKPGELNSISPHLAQIQSDMMRKADRWNRERVLELKKIRSKNIVTGLLIGSTVLAIYAYTIRAIRQETFLDDLDEPERMEQ
ncbi:hypothetical protein BV898_14412 [Hypsibius exemplaris]|uniref:Cytochrome c oxidase assembly factor 3 n=1 Tax=Hypsibius exemplaris TaxID=2072580 RepID=A0A9X6N8K9_HYPEX|nr:hypothetical protein BV898_14412 [Hypsibius exemplaris]